MKCESDCSVSKIILNDTSNESSAWEPNKENLIFNFCVGVWVGGHPRQTTRFFRKITSEKKLYSPLIKGFNPDITQILTPNSGSIIFHAKSAEMSAFNINFRKCKTHHSNPNIKSWSLLALFSSSGFILISSQETFNTTVKAANKSLF